MNKTNRFRENAPGKYYVNQNCIGCTLCSEIASHNFRINTNEELDVIHSYVCRQPEGIREEELCAEAMASCPADAIGNEDIKS